VPLRRAALVLLATALAAVAAAWAFSASFEHRSAAARPVSTPATPAFAERSDESAPLELSALRGQPYGVARELLRDAGVRWTVDASAASSDDLVAVAGREAGVVHLVLSDNPLGTDREAPSVAMRAAPASPPAPAATDRSADVDTPRLTAAVADPAPLPADVAVPVADPADPAPGTEPVGRSAAATPTGVEVTCDDAYRLCVKNSDGSWIVQKAVDPASHRAPGSIVSFAPADRADGSLLVSDSGEPGVVNDPRYGGLGAFGWQEARRVGCCDERFVDGASEVSADHAWSIDGRNSAATDGFGVARTFVHRKPTFLDAGTLAFGLTVEFKDLFADPIMRVTYDYEFYDTGPGTVDGDAAPGGVRVWTSVETLCPNGQCGSTNMTAFLKEPKLVASLAPSSAGGLEYRHVSVLDDSGNAVSQCKLDGIDQADGSDPSLPDSCQVPRLALEAGAVQVRFDDGTDGCDPVRHQCFSASFRAYPGGMPPHASGTYPWANPQYGPYAWAQAAWSRDCFAPLGADAGMRADGCAPAFSDTLGGCLGGAESGPLAGPAGLLTRWEVHQKDGAAQVLLPAWEGGFGAYDCPAALRRFGPDESWGLYANYTYGAGVDLAG